MPWTCFPPDEALDKLAKVVNKKLPQGVSINLYRVAHDDGPEETGIVYCCGAIRSSQRTREMLTEHDAPRLISAVTGWAAQAQAMNRWTTDPSDA